MSEINKVDVKPTNPKDAIAGSKLDYTCIPDTLKMYVATAFMEGALKYGKFNWRHAGVRASVYISALQRHLDKWVAGEEVDPETGVKHLANAMACLGILMDAQAHDKLTDDRPEPSEHSFRVLKEQALAQVALKTQFAEHNPKHYTRENAWCAPAQLELPL